MAHFTPSKLQFDFNLSPIFIIQYVAFFFADFSTVNKMLGDTWHTIPEKEKMVSAACFNCCCCFPSGKLLSSRLKSELCGLLWCFRNYLPQGYLH